MSYAQLREVLLPAEPAGLELGAIELADGTGSLAMILRHEHTRTDQPHRHQRSGGPGATTSTQQRKEADTVSAAQGDADHGARDLAAFRPCPTWPSGPSAAASSWANDELFAERENLIKPEAAELHDRTRSAHKGKVVRRVGDPPPPRAAATTGAGPARRARRRARRRRRHRLTSRATTRREVVGRGRWRRRATRRPAELRGGRRGCRSSRARRCKGDTATASRSTPGERWSPTSGWPCTPTAASPGCGCTARSCPTRGCSTRGTRRPGRAGERRPVVGLHQHVLLARPNNLIAPGQARIMGEGWETARRRDDGNDWVLVRLAGAGVVRLAELDTHVLQGQRPGAGRRCPASTRCSAGAGTSTTRTLVRAHCPSRALAAGHPAPVPDRPRPAPGDPRPAGHLPRRRHGPAAAVRRPGTRGRGELGVRWFNALSERPRPAALPELGRTGRAAEAVAARPVSGAGTTSPAAALALLLGRSG